MGYYINPPSESKESFLMRESAGFPSSRREAPEWKDVPAHLLPVVLVNNGAFTAAGIAFSEREYDAFIKHDRSGRSMVVYLVPITALLVTNPEIADLVADRSA